jgi:GUN4-like/NACHT domain
MGAEATYLLCQALDCRDYKPEGMGKRNRIATPMLQEVFVPLELDSGAIPAGLRMDRRKDIEAFEQMRQMQCIWDFLRATQAAPAYRQLAIVAWGGFGKTTLLKHLAYIYGTRQHGRFKVPHLVPVLLPLRQYRRQIVQEQPPTLPELVMQYHVTQLAELDAKRNRLAKLSPNWMRDVLSNGRALVMFDGFDEIPESERPAFSQWIAAQMRRFDKSVFILTSRPIAYEEDFVEPLRTKIWVRPLTQKQQTAFVQQWYLCQEKLDRAGRDTPEVQREAQNNAQNLLDQIHDRNRPELADLARNPLLLTLLATYHRSDPGMTLPRQRAELYQDICILQLRKRPDARGVALLLLPNDRQAVLQSVALTMMQRRLKLIDEKELVELIAQVLKAQEHPEVSAVGFLNQIVNVSELIVRQGLEGCEFAHLSFQEFLAAAQIKALKQEALLYPHLKDANGDQPLDDDRSWWRQTILLYAAQTNPTNLIKEAIAQGAVILADAAYRETSRSISPTIAGELKNLNSTVQDLKYAQLAALLKIGKWEEADRETYRLMITMVGKEEGQWFDREDLENLPRADLLKIDQLWVTSSNGHFGFSVQKQIWEVCGSPMSSNRNWDYFCVEVGWKTFVEATSYIGANSKLKSNPSISPVGELPYLKNRERIVEYRPTNTLCYLFSRKDL